MPSATKGAASSVETNDSMQVVMSVVEKKARNLEKKRIRQLELKQKEEEGVKLDKDQKEALDRLAVTEALLGFAKDLQKQFAQMQQEVQRQTKKRAQQDKQAVDIAVQEAEKQALKQLLQLQAVLDQLGEENRSYFLEGTSGAILVSEEQLGEIDRFLELISVRLVDEEGLENHFKSTLATACEHTHLYLKHSNKRIGELNMTYKQMHDLIDQIEGCEFFQQPHVRLQAASKDAAQLEDDALVSEAHDDEHITQPEVSDLAASGVVDYSSRGSSVSRDQPLASAVSSLHVESMSQAPMTMPSAAAPAATYSVFPISQPPANDSGIDFFHESKVMTEPVIPSQPREPYPTDDHHSSLPLLGDVSSPDAAMINDTLADDDNLPPDDLNDQQDEGSHGGYSRGGYRNYRGGDRGYGRRGRGSYRGGGRGGYYRNNRNDKQEWSGAGRGGYRGRGSRGRGGRGGNRGGNNNSNGGSNYRGGYKNQQPVQQAA